ncbi:hypothetical protein BBF96_12575 [Anoxybacter fermentans]|uniref:NADH dehydrogenase n=1 Tax=Anoxybacter fermentans TaxID=1323375 RepID=A0A3Q9HRW3_9FIRM|nr:NAD(P)H-dependent oxidoreductase subunit E [Anoxybacter fermentans]AZR74158.1 hypothetical protein BBF96_12575 [Anoxybacter fermentans]
MKKHLVEVCIGTSCHLMGAQDLIRAVQGLPGEKLNSIQLKTVPCLKSCDKSPAVRINGQIFAPITPEELIKKIT